MDKPANIRHKMTASELAQVILEWEDQQREADRLADYISGYVLDLGVTVTVGDARASYSKGRSAYLWENTCRVHEGMDEKMRAKFTAQPTIVPGKIDWIGIAGALGIDKGDVMRSPSTPSVKLILL